MVFFRPDQVQQAVNAAQFRNTQLTAWMQYNADHGQDDPNCLQVFTYSSDHGLLFTFQLMSTLVIRKLQVDSY